MLPLPLLLQGLGTFQLHSQAALKGLTSHSIIFMCSWVEPVHQAIVVYIIRQDHLPASQQGSIKRTDVPFYMRSWVEPVHQALVVYIIRQEHLSTSLPDSIKRYETPFCKCSWVEPVHQALVVYIIRQEQLHSQTALKGLTPHAVCAPG